MNEALLRQAFTQNYDLMVEKMNFEVLLPHLRQEGLIQPWSDYLISLIKKNEDKNRFFLHFCLHIRKEEELNDLIDEMIEELEKDNYRRLEELLPVDVIKDGLPAPIGAAVDAIQDVKKQKQFILREYIGLNKK